MEEGKGEDAGMTMQFFSRGEDAGVMTTLFLPHISSTLFFLPDTVVTGPELKLQVPGTGMIS